MPKSSQLVRTVLEALPNPVVLCSRDDGVILYANEHAARVFGIPLSKLIGGTSENLYRNPKDREQILAHIERDGFVRDRELPLQGPKGHTLWAVANVEPLTFDGKPALCSSFLDITDRKKLERANQKLARDQAHALAETKRQLTTLIGNLPGLAYRCRNDGDWSMELVSEGCEELTGYTPEQLIAKDPVSYADLILEEDRECVWEEMQAAVEENRRYHLEYRIRRRNGEVRWVWEQGVGVYDRSGALIALEGIVHDVTDRHRAAEASEVLEAQVRTAQRMEAVGRLAGGVAHDFNNVLTVIQSYASFLREAIPDGDPAREDVDVIREAAGRASRLTTQLLAFSRRQVQELRVVELGGIVGGMEKMLRRLIGEDIDFVTQLHPDAGPVKVDVSQIEQIIMNLAVNARDAMPNGGSLTLEVRPVILDGTFDPEKGAHVEPGPYVLLAVSDTGTGIDEKVRSQIFEPFFTTKEKGRGTGLGLSTVYGIVKQSEGYIWVYSEPDKGTTFKIYLPRAKEPAADRPSDERMSASSADVTETILVVEDEDMVRHATERILTRRGYRVVSVSDPSEALHVLSAHDPPVDLILTDVIMPGMSGQELAERARKDGNEARVLFMSGYTDDAIVHHGVLDPGTAFLQKPFTRDELLRKVRATIDAV